MKDEWKYMRGLLTVKVKAKSEDTGKFIYFNFDCIADEKLDNYDFGEYLDDVIRALANLRRAYKPEIIGITKI